MYKAIIFDFFDVIRTDPYLTWLKSQGLKREGEYHKASQDLDAGKILVPEFFERLSRLQGRPVTEEELEKGVVLFEDVLELIGGVKKHYKTALLSNAPSAFLRGLLKQHDLEKYFDEIIISSEVGHVKPLPEIFGITLQRLGVDASEAVFVDDNTDNIAGAELVGIQGVVFKSADQLQRELAKLGVTLKDS